MARGPKMPGGSGPFITGWRESAPSGEGFRRLHPGRRRLRDKLTGLTATVRMNTERVWSTFGSGRR